MKTIILDTETTGLPPKGEACEIAWFEVPSSICNLALAKSPSGLQTTEEAFKVEQRNFIKSTGKLINQFHQTFMPKGDFHPKASECNGFTKENLTGSPCISTFKFPDDVSYMIGHNINFDWQILGAPKNIQLICTKELAITYLTKESGAGTKGTNTLTGLITRYYPEEAAELISNAHSALQDCKLCYLILLKILEAAPELDSFEKLAAQCTQPTDKLPYGIDRDSYTKEYRFSFGKYTGIAFSRIDKVSLHKYMLWIVEKSTMNQGLKNWVKQFLVDNK